MTNLLPSAPAQLTERPRGALRWFFSRLRTYGSRVTPPPATPHEQAAYGFAQPLLGMRVLSADMALLQEALIPPVVLGFACAIWASVQGGHSTTWEWVKHFYTAFAALAPLPTVIFANHYARLAAVVRWRLGFGACGPREMPFGMLIGRLIRQTLIVAVGSAPFFLLKGVPLVGKLAFQAAIAAWGLHWVVADAFDDAQVLAPGDTLRQSLAKDRNAPQPWFVRLVRNAADHTPVRFLSRLMHKFASVCDKLAMDSRGELEVMEKNRAISVGFSLSTAALMAVPGLNLLFRPIILVASSHLLGQLEKHEASEAEIQISAHGSGAP